MRSSPGCAESGDLLDGTLRPGAVGSADGALEFIQRVVERVRRVCESVLVRLDAGFPDGQTLKGLESAGIDYVARIRNNAVLDRMAEPYLRRPPGRPPREGRVWCHELRYQARFLGARAAGWCWWWWSGPESCSSITSG